MLHYGHACAPCQLVWSSLLMDAAVHCSGCSAGKRRLGLCLQVEAQLTTRAQVVARAEKAASAAQAEASRVFAEACKAHESTQQ
jgi:hypothetical protein